MATVAKITIYPIKSLDGVEVSQIEVSPGGSLVGDREFALFDGDDRLVNGKRTAKVHQLRSRFDLDDRLVNLRVEGSKEETQFHLDGDRADLDTWLSDYFGYPVCLKQNTVGGFPDDSRAFGPTIISTATLETASSWYHNIDADQMRSRLRANIEIDGVPAFWEDNLFAETDKEVRFTIGDVTFLGTNPCSRCVVPTRNPKTGESVDRFSKIFAIQRQTLLPKWTAPSRFNHYYRLATNTKILPTEAGKVLQLGDPVKILDMVEILG